MIMIEDRCCNTFFLNQREFSEISNLVLLFIIDSKNDI